MPSRSCSAVPICRSGTTVCLCRPGSLRKHSSYFSRSAPRRARVNAPNTCTATCTPARRASRAMQCYTRLWHVRSALSMLEHVMPTPCPFAVRAAIRSCLPPSGAPGRSLDEGAPPAPPCTMQHAQPTGCCSSCTLAYATPSPIPRPGSGRPPARCDSLRLLQFHQARQLRHQLAVLHQLHLLGQHALQLPATAAPTVAGSTSRPS
jgi:hypothetical protein